MNRNDLYELKLQLRPEEIARLRELAGQFRQTPEELIGGYIADLTNSDGSNGEEEHKAALHWFETVYRNWG